MTQQAQADASREDISYCFEGPYGAIPATGTKAITAASNAAPIVVTSASHGYQSGQSLDIAGVGGNTNANGRWDILVIDANNYSLVGSQGNSAYTSGGTSQVAVHAMRNTGDTPKYNVQKIRSKEKRSDRKAPGLILTQADADMSINIELSHREYDFILAAGLQSQWQVYGHRGVGAVFTGTTSASNTLTASVAPTGASAFTLLKKGQWVSLKGLSTAVHNNKMIQVSKTTAPTTTVLVFEGTPFSVNSAQGAACQVTAARLQEGTLMRGMDFERAYRDIVQFQAYRGLMIDGFGFQFQQGNILGGTVTLMGKDGLPFAVTTSLPYAATASATYDQLNAVTGVSNIQQDGSAQAKSLMQVTLNVSNQLRKRYAIGASGPIGIGNGSYPLISGAQEAYLEDGTRFTSMVNNSPFSFGFGVADLSGNGMYITVPRARFSDTNPGASAENVDFTDPGAFDAEADLGNADAALQSCIIIDRFGDAF